MSLEAIIDLHRHPLGDEGFRETSREALDADGVLMLRGFLREDVLAALVAEAARNEDQAFFAASTHNVYLTPQNPDLDADHVFNRQVVSTKGCICDDQVEADSPLRVLYNAPEFHSFLCSVLNEGALYPYADPLSSINIHYAPAGKELGWHFDNSEFAITLLLQKPTGGGAYEYIKDLRNAEQGEMNYPGVKAALDGALEPTRLDIEPGTLVLFRGRNALHRVTPTQGETTRYLVVLAYNGEPGVSLSESARQTFYGRVR